MGDISRHSLSSSGLHFLHRLLSVLAALVVLSLSARATAATNPNPVVPMCGDRNESVAAPPIFRAREPGSIVALPCHAVELEAGESAPPVPERIVVQERPERVLAFSALCTKQSASLRLAIESSHGALERPGFASELLRPPRS
jgi:hypothetical protein